MSARAFWARIGVVTALALTLAIAVSPPRPRDRVPALLALAFGAASGAGVFAAAVRRRPRVGPLRCATPSTVGRHLFFGLCATNEEVLWRRLLLGELLPAGQLVALAVSSAAFALAHRRGRALHAGTGAAFGALYLVTGVLGASIAAHWVYNAFVASLAGRAPP